VPGRHAQPPAPLAGARHPPGDALGQREEERPPWASEHAAHLQLEAALDGAAAAMRQREAAVHASYRRDLVPYQEVQQTSALVVWRPKRQQQSD